jgi:hypothetical protein
MDGLGLEPLCVCGLLGHVPKSTAKGPSISRSCSVEGLMVGKRIKDRHPKGKAPMGYEGSWPKFSFKPKLRVLSQPGDPCKGQGLHPKK